MERSQNGEREGRSARDEAKSRASGTLASDPGSIEADAQESPGATMSRETEMQRRRDMVASHVGAMSEKRRQGEKRMLGTQRTSPREWLVRVLPGNPIATNWKIFRPGDELYLDEPLAVNMVAQGRVELVEEE
jgi:hypothetical protein